MTSQQVIFEDLGRMGYQQAWDYQDQLMQANLRIKADLNESLRAAGTDPAVLVIASTQHHLLFVEHDPVYTIGKSGHEANILISPEDRLTRQIDFFRTNRGGDITYHGPGQIVGYPILDLEHFYTDIGKYIRNIEEVLIRTMAYYGLKGDRSKGETGVWLEPSVKGKERKICAIGVRCSRWITMHGFAFNVNTDLDYFNNIVPCGIPDKQVTSLEKELGEKVSMEEVKQQVKKSFEEVFEVELVREVGEE